MGKLETTIASIPYLTTISRNKGHIITTKDIPTIIAEEGYSFIGWNPNPVGHEVQEDIISPLSIQRQIQQYPKQKIRKN